MDGTLPYDCNNANWYLDGKGSFVGTLMGWKENGQFTIREIVFWENGRVFLMGHLQKGGHVSDGTYQWSQPSRDYLYTNSEFVANDTLISPMSTSKSQSKVIKTNTYSYTDRNMSYLGWN